MALKKKDTPLITPEEYLARERASVDQKHEYVGGEIFAMVGASRAHMLIEMNVISLLRAQLKGKACCPFGSNLKVIAGSKNAFYYPDVTVVCGDLQYLDDSKDVVVNPKVIIEVLSPSTSKYDRSEKFFRYQQIESVSEYILTSQDMPLMEIRRRQEKQEWTLRIVEGFDSSLVISSISCTLPFSEIYDRVWDEE